MMRLVSTVVTILWASGAWAGDVKVDPSVYVPYTERSSPRIASEWGPDALKGINRLRKQSAQKVVRFKACNGISTSQLSVSRSVVPDTWVVIVVCRNGRRFYVSRKDVATRDQTWIIPMDDRPA